MSLAESQIALGNGRVAIISAEDAPFVQGISWCWCPTDREGRGYVSGWPLAQGATRRVYLHRLIAKAGSGDVVDHVNGNTLDNRRQNLRLCSPSQNQANRLAGRNNTSGAKGVHWVEQGRCWRAQITINRKKHSLGRFSTVEEASAAYARAAEKAFGEFAKHTSAQAGAAA
jgi:hypothetical protein